jgi:hypothetical protein
VREHARTAAIVRDRVGTSSDHLRIVAFSITAALSGRLGFRLLLILL